MKYVAIACVVIGCILWGARCSVQSLNIVINHSPRYIATHTDYGGTGDFPVRPGARFKGRVVDKDGRGLPGVEVFLQYLRKFGTEIISTQAIGPVVTASSGEGEPEGTFIFCDTPEGDARLVVRTSSPGSISLFHQDLKDVGEIVNLGDLSFAPPLVETLTIGIRDMRATPGSLDPTKISVEFMVTDEFGALGMGTLGSDSKLQFFTNFSKDPQPRIEDGAFVTRTSPAPIVVALSGIENLDPDADAVIAVSGKSAPLRSFPLGQPGLEVVVSDRPERYTKIHLNGLPPNRVATAYVINADRRVSLIEDILTSDDQDFFIDREISSIGAPFRIEVVSTEAGRIYHAPLAPIATTLHGEMTRFARVPPTIVELADAYSSVAGFTVMVAPKLTQGTFYRFASFDLCGQASIPLLLPGKFEIQILDRRGSVVPVSLTKEGRRENKMEVDTRVIESPLELYLR